MLSAVRKCIVFAIIKLASSSSTFPSWVDKKKNTDSVDVDEVSDLDKEVSDSVINYSKFIDRDLHVGDFDLAFKIVKVRYPIQLIITESKEKNLFMGLVKKKIQVTGNMLFFLLLPTEVYLLSKYFCEFCTVFSGYKNINEQSSKTQSTTVEV